MDAAGGLPVWLCSVSKRDDRGVVPTARWRREDRRYSEILIDRVLGDAGDRAVERQFRMCVTACRHRATTRAERAALPPSFFACLPVDIAGAPVEVLWSRGIPPEHDACRPCRNPGREPLPGGLYLVVPCDNCEACVENERARVRIQTFRAAHPDRYLIETI